MKIFSKEQRYILWILTLINFFNYVDRQVIFPLFGSIKLEFGISDFQLGLLGTLFMLIHSLISVPLGILADTYSRKAVIAIGVTFWSVVTLLSGFARSFKELLLLRSLVGIGEASYAPASTAIISDVFPQNVRSRVQGIYNIGMFAGGSVGAMLGAFVVFYLHSWRLAFLIVGIPGLLLAFLVKKIKYNQPSKEENEKKTDIRSLWKNRAYIWLLISGTFVTFSSGAFISWGIEFIHRYKGYNLRDASIILGSIMIIAGIIGIISGSYLADKAYARFAWGRSAVIAVSLILAMPFVMFGIYEDKGLFFIMYFFIGTLLLSFYHGPVTAVIHDIVPKDIHSSAYAVYLLVIHLLGDTLSPAVTGAISDHLNLKVGMGFAGLLVLLSGLAFIPVCYFIKNNNYHIRS